MADRYSRIISTLYRLPEELRTEAFERLFQACEISRFEPEVKLKYEKETC